jgi:hypothetical protein
VHLLLVKYVRVVELDVFGVQEILDRWVERVGRGRIGERHLSLLVVLVEWKKSATVVVEIDDSEKGAINGVYLFFHAAAGFSSCDSCKDCRQLTPPLYHRVGVGGSLSITLEKVTYECLTLLACRIPSVPTDKGRCDNSCDKPLIMDEGKQR